MIFYSVQVFASSLKNYNRSNYLVLLSWASITELAIMILLIIEFLLMSRFLNNILSKEQKNMADRKKKILNLEYDNKNEHVPQKQDQENIFQLSTDYTPLLFPGILKIDRRTRG